MSQMGLLHLFPDSFIDGQLAFLFTSVDLSH